MTQIRISQLPVANIVELTDDIELIFNVNNVTKRQTFGEIKSALLSCESLCARVDITSAEILNMNASPILLIDAPPAGFGHIITDVIMRVPTYGGIAFATNIQAEILKATQSGNYLGFVVTVDGQRWTLLDDADFDCINTGAFYLSNSTGNPTAGNSDIQLFIQYRRVNLLP